MRVVARLAAAVISTVGLAVAGVLASTAAHGAQTVDHSVVVQSGIQGCTVLRDFALDYVDTSCDGNPNQRHRAVAKCFSGPGIKTVYGQTVQGHHDSWAFCPNGWSLYDGWLEAMP